MSHPNQRKPESAGPSRSRRASSLSPAKEFERLQRSLELADAANHKRGRSRAKSQPPLSHLHHGTTLNSEEATSSKTISPRPTYATDPTSVRGQAPFRLKLDYIYSYDCFHYRIEELVHRAKSDGGSERVIVLFTAGDRDPSGKNDTWCNECNYLESLISKFKCPVEQPGYLVRVKVGTLEEWMSLSNPYRLDKTIKLKLEKNLLINYHLLQYTP